MSIHFHPLTIKDVRRETAECVSIAFTIPETLHDTFRFREGQNITVRTLHNGEEIRRSYSVCSSPLEGELRVAVKAVQDGRFSQFANQQLKAGDTLEVMPPTGKFNTILDPKNELQYLAIAAGSGITPIISIIKTVLATELKSQFTLVYGNRTRASIIFREELEAIKNKYMDRFRLIHLLSREQTEAAIFSGRMDAEKMNLLSDKLIPVQQMDQVFLCGPADMIFTLREALTGKGIDPNKIHAELFTVPGQSKAEKHEQKNYQVDLSKNALVTIKSDGLSLQLNLSYDGQPILDAALAAGADLPFACKGGVCSTCKAKLISGQVEMEVNYALEPDELAAGFILTCQSHPRSAELFIDFDQA